jgi:uncharacterized RDD family membrane protein YckC
MNYPLAGFFRRAVALTLDCLILEVLGAAVSAPLQYGFGLDFEDLLQQITSGRVHWQEFLIFFTLYSVLLFVLWTGYFTIFIGMAGQTPGKKLLKIQVVRADGAPMDMKTAFNRFMGFTLSASVLFLGCLWSLFDANKQTWHDKMARTLVVRVNPTTHIS